MSNVNMLDCPICNPTVADAQGIRRTVVPTATELFNFVQHVINVHTTLPQTSCDAINAKNCAEIALSR